VTDTRTRLLAAAIETLRVDGIAGLSARTIATSAGANQALVFYHFKTVAGLVDAAVRGSVDESVEFYRTRFAATTSLVDLLRVGRELHERERASGNVAVMAQLMAGAQHDPVLRASATHAMQAWNTEIETVVRRLLAGSPLADVADARGLARAISASFLGLELYDGVDASGARAALDAIEQLGVLIEVFDDLGPIARRAVKSRVRRARSSTS
jgi:AcrR family transcriptional regulator